MLSLPLIALLGTMALWVLLPHLGLVLVLLWGLIRRNDRDRTLCEELKIWSDLITVHRRNPRAPDQFWQANPYWTTVQIRYNPDVENYLTLKGSGREIEIGAFLTPHERQELRDRIEEALKQL